MTQRSSRRTSRWRRRRRTRIRRHSSRSSSWSVGTSAVGRRCSPRPARAPSRRPKATGPSTERLPTSLARARRTRTSVPARPDRVAADDPVHAGADVVAADDPARQRRLAWAVLMKRAYAVDVLVCPRCAGPMRLLSVIQEESVARRILEHFRLPARAPPRGGPWRAAGQEQLSLDEPDRFDGIDATYPS